MVERGLIISMKEIKNKMKINLKASSMKLLGKNKTQLKQNLVRCFIPTTLFQIIRVTNVVDIWRIQEV